MDHHRLDQAETASRFHGRISAPLTARFIADRALDVPAVLDRLWRHWRACARSGKAPRATAMELDHLRHLNCLGRFVAHLSPDHQGEPRVRVASQSPSEEAAAGSHHADLATLESPEAAELAEDWQIILGGRPVLRVVAGSATPFDRPLARLCLPIRTDSESIIDSMVMSVEPADPALADLCARPLSNRPSCNTDDAAPAGLGRSAEPSSLPLETRLAFKERIQEAIFELKRQAADRPDAERRGMLLEAARLQRLAQRY